MRRERTVYDVVERLDWVAYLYIEYTEYSLWDPLTQVTYAHISAYNMILKQRLSFPPCVKSKLGSETTNNVDAHTSWHPRGGDAVMNGGRFSRHAIRPCDETGRPARAYFCIACNRSRDMYYPQ